MEITHLPGGDLIGQGLRDLEQGFESIPALLVSIGRPKLEMLGIKMARHVENPEKKLYFQLVEQHGDAAHGRYNALIRRLVSFERAAACEL